MKYDFELDMVEKNSLSIIAGRLSKGSTVLEFGPANGRLTRYMKTALDCKVYIVEIDENAAQDAGKFAEGVLIDDIEKYNWIDKFQHISFDYILFADVLEHLTHPAEVLRAAQRLLKDDGSILVSVPNVAHNSVLIDLLNNKFTYRKVGLLDDTHLRFFTEQNLRGMAAECGLVPIYEDAVYKKVEETEFGNYYNDLPKSVHHYLKTRPYNRIYQFVFQFVKQAYTETGLQPSVSGELIRDYNHYIAQLYIDYGSGYVESDSTRLPVSGVHQQVEFEIPRSGIVKELRFDPVDASGRVVMNEMYVTLIDGSTQSLQPYDTNAGKVLHNHYLFLTEDPQFIVRHDDWSSVVKLTVTYELYDVDMDVESDMVRHVLWLNDRLDEYRKHAEQLEQQHSETVAAFEVRESAIRQSMQEDKQQAVHNAEQAAQHQAELKEQEFSAELGLLQDQLKKTNHLLHESENRELGLQQSLAEQQKRNVELEKRNNQLTAALNEIMQSKFGSRKKTIDKIRSEIELME